MHKNNTQGVVFRESNVAFARQVNTPPQGCDEELPMKPRDMSFLNTVTETGLESRSASCLSEGLYLSWITPYLTCSRIQL